MTRIYTNILKDQDEYHYSWRLERYVRDGDEPLLGELAGKWFIKGDQWKKNRRKRPDPCIVAAGKGERGLGAGGASPDVVNVLRSFPRHPLHSISRLLGSSSPKHLVTTLQVPYAY